MELVSPKPLRPGDTLGVFTPSSPAYSDNPGLFENGVRVLERLGFRMKLGSLTSRRASEGYRSGSPQARAEEFMELVRDPEVHGLISTIGGMNSSSMIPYLDFAAIRSARKMMCGFSDVTSLHLALLRYSGLRTFYGPSVMCWFGDWPDGVPESSEWFLDAVTDRSPGARRIECPPRWSNHKRRWDNGDWKNVPREWRKHEGWRVLSPGSTEAPILALNLNTLLSAAGTDYWPEFRGRILLIEDMDAPMARNERSFRQLERIGVFDEIAGLILGRPELHEPAPGAVLDYEGQLMEVLGARPYPVISRFDCSHTLPMLTLPQLAQVRLQAAESTSVSFEILPV